MNNIYLLPDLNVNRLSDNKIDDLICGLFPNIFFFLAFFCLCRLVLLVQRKRSPFDNKMKSV